ncbi:MAG: fibronectin type III domain-containing protein [Paludibacteraceae bacterium]|nr:fibronectin type III domain-containing protein [Paludibacteraceae bacterium]
MLFKRNIWAAMLAGMLLAGTNVSAQVLYSCDFENPTENAAWTINKTSNARPLSGFNNIWYIGAAGNCATGTNGLYIAAKTDTATNAAVPITGPIDYVVSYRDNISLGAPGTYALSFDWRCAGKSTDMLSVFWFPSTYTSNTNSNYGAASLPTAWTAYKIGDFRGSPIWQSAYITFTSTTASGKLLLVWYQSGGGVTNPPAAIDNIEIGTVGCSAPTGLKYNSNGSLSWNGTAASYDVRYSNTNANTWTVVTGVTGNSFPVSGITEGYYMFQVRANCADGTHSKWVSVEQFAFLKGLRCVDFMDLDSTAMCYTGSSDNTSYNAKQHAGKVDHGYQSIQSQHTIHYIPGETDERTNGGLRTIPYGEVASVRLGNWAASYGAECIEYKLKVQPGASDILKLKYAVVLEYASHHQPGDAEFGPHGSNEQSHFYLSIMDAQGHILDEGCSSFNFSPSPAALSDPTWHLTEYGSLDVMWKDWTEVSISLAKYIGKTITIHLATYDCTASAHFGYAYFAINCENGQLEGISCGDYSTDHFTAPAGFNYRWYRQNDRNKTVLDTARTFHIATSDTTVYLVDVINKINNCYYVLTANPNPRFPETKVTYQASQKDCQNMVRFNNQSGVVLINRVTGVKTISDEKLDDISWDFGDGTPIIHSVDSVIEHTFPQSGGTFTVKVKSSMSGGTCEDEQIYTITLPELGDKRVETVVPYCFDGKTPYVYNGVSHYESFQDSAVYHLASDCDSTDVLTVNFMSTVTSELYDTICHEVYNYTYNGTVYPDAGDYPVKFQSYLGCDSIVTLHLYKHPQPQIQVDTAFASCADEISGLFIPYILRDADKTVDRIDVLMDDEAVANGFAPAFTFGPGEPLYIDWPVDINPNIYQGRVVFSSQECISYSYDFKIELYYPSATLDQKNGVVAIMNEGYNGGYNFLSYQWYRNGERMEGETKSYVRVSDEKDMNAEYYVVVLRNEDNVVLRTCPIIYTGGGWRDALDKVTEDAKAVKVIRDGNLYIIRDGVWYTVLGTVMKHEQ